MRGIVTGSLLLAGISLLTLPFVWAQVSPNEDVFQYTPVGLPPEQVGRYIDDVPPASIKFARAAMYDPKLAAQLREKFKTPELKQAEERARLAILEPNRFRQMQEEADARKGPKTAAEIAAQEREKRLREDAKRAILYPAEVAREKERMKEPATRRREEIAAQAILHPREFNSIVQERKSPQLRERELDAIRAFTQPEAFLEERERLKMTGSKQPLKPQASSANDNVKPVENPNETAPEKR
jgi:hypothetical protein